MSVLQPCSALLDFLNGLIGGDGFAFQGRGGLWRFRAGGSGLNVSCLVRYPFMRLRSICLLPSAVQHLPFYVEW